ncbi:hypothetical protein F2Q69_00028036 [Brassica cretica]|uniref:Uncharacterized protein n=1 Tax=Brassica cretica TaxID=69181 RepID=A0A8S9S9G8_BRACR|nr:hypothetical protein F2Q69_00028036 [Brassica cretica]
MAGKEYVNFKRTRSDGFGNIRVQRKLLLEHGIKKKGMLTWGLTWGKEKMTVLMTQVVFLVFSFKRFYVRRFCCDFVLVVEIKLWWNIQWQDFKDVIQGERRNKYKFDRLILEICYTEIPPLIDVVQRGEIRNSGLRYSVWFYFRFYFYHDLGYANVLLYHSETFACHHQSTWGMLLMVCVEKVNGDDCLYIRSVLLRYLFTTSEQGVSHTTLSVRICQITKSVLMTLWDVGDGVVLHIFYSISLFGLCARIPRRLLNPLQLFLMELKSVVLLPLSILYELQWHMLLWSEKLDEEGTQVGGRINLLSDCTSNFMSGFTLGEKEDTSKNVLSCVLILGFGWVIVTSDSTHEKLFSFWNQEILLRSSNSVFLIDFDSSVFPPPSFTCFSIVAWLMAAEISVWRCTRLIYILEWFYRWVRPPSCLRELLLVGVIDLSDTILTNGASKGKLKFCDRIHFDVVFPRDKSGLFSVNQSAKVDFWVSIHNLYSIRRRRFLHGTSYVNWWSDFTCNSSKSSCVILNEDVISFHGYISLHSRKGAFVGVQLFSHNMLNGGDLRMSIQHHEFYNIICVAIDLFTCNQVQYTTHCPITEKSEDLESSEERAVKATRMLQLKRMDLTTPQGPKNRKAWPGLGKATARSVGLRVWSLGLTLEYF